MFKLKKVSGTRAFVCLLILMTLLTAWAFAETTPVEASDTRYMV